MNNVNKMGLKQVVMATTCLMVLTLTDGTYADELKYQRQVEPIELIINFQVTGELTGATAVGAPVYTIGGPGYAPEKIFKTGEISDGINKHRKVADLENAQITFSGMPTDPVLAFTCLPGSCSLSFADGSVLQSNAGVELQGRAANLWGPVIKSPNFDPVNGIMPIRILGCGGLKEVAGKGRYAGMVGSICFNGVLNFNQFDQTKLTGSSKCTVTLHTPMDVTRIP